MDDAYLSKLSVDQTGLRPTFSKETFEYEIQVASSVTILRIAATTSDKGASLSIKSGSGYGDECKLTDGQNKIQIEVTSEDGTMKKYFINCLKMSASEAQLVSLEIVQLTLVPNFKPDVFDYETNVGFRQTECQIKADFTDFECTVEVSCNNKQTNKLNDLYVCSLNYGFSEIQVKLTSPNKLKTQVYNIITNRDWIPRICSFSGDIEKRLELEDPISMVALWRPIKMNSYNLEVNYSLSFFNFFKKVSSPDDLLNVISQSNSSNYSQSLNINLENKLSEAQVSVPFICNGS